MAVTTIDVDDLRRGGGWLPRYLPSMSLEVDGHVLARRNGSATLSELESWVSAALSRAVGRR